MIHKIVKLWIYWQNIIDKNDIFILMAVDV